ncbi:hypothetical protein Gohar_020621 [Gossypium harknessii]|uniref:Uncharacterized protein n=1 Tax=Gossypium harknessii TaxID=34285 RepID=A0A7J9HYC5_9ROSI|nr:hypothetical protein [Gossypium harknessii]
MTSKLVASHRERTEIYHEASLCKQKTQVLLHQFHLPKGLMPLNHLNEFGYNKTTWFIWLKQEKTFKYLFKELGLTSYGVEITAFIGDRQLKKLTGRSKIYCSNSMGLSKSYPVTTVEDEPKELK